LGQGAKESNNGCAQEEGKMANAINARQMDHLLDSLYGVPGTQAVPVGINGEIWAMPRRSCCYPWVRQLTHHQTDQIKPGEAYFLHYYQNQGYGPTTNECVTTSALIAMNMMTEWVTANLGSPVESNLRIEDYAARLDNLGLRGWQYRFPTHSPLPGMMHPLQAVHALRDHARELQRKYRKSYKVNLKSGCSVNEVVFHLQQGHLILLHGAWLIRIGSAHSHLAFLGGMPHTMVLVGLDGSQGKWLFLNPGHPWPVDQNTQVTPDLYSMGTVEMMNFWGRRFLFYPPRFSITVLIPEV